MTDYNSITEPEPTFQPRERERTKGRKHLLLLVGGTALGCLIVGTMLGASLTPAPAAAKPLPAKTIEVEVPVVDEVCKEVALELFDQLRTVNSGVVMPLLNAGKTMNNELLAVVDGGVLALNIDAVTGATSDIRGANGTLESLTTRIEAIGPDYTTCVG